MSLEVVDSTTPIRVLKRVATSLNVESSGAEKAELVESVKRARLGKLGFDWMLDMHTLYPSVSFEFDDATRKVTKATVTFDDASDTPVLRLARDKELTVYFESGHIYLETNTVSIVDIAEAIERAIMMHIGHNLKLDTACHRLELVVERGLFGTDLTATLV